MNIQELEKEADLLRQRLKKVEDKIRSHEISVKMFKGFRVTECLESTSCIKVSSSRGSVKYSIEDDKVTPISAFIKVDNSDEFKSVVDYILSK